MAITTKERHLVMARAKKQKSDDWIDRHIALAGGDLVQALNDNRRANLNGGWHEDAATVMTARYFGLTDSAVANLLGVDDPSDDVPQAVDDEIIKWGHKYRHVDGTEYVMRPGSPDRVTAHSESSGQTYRDFTTVVEFTKWLNNGTYRLVS